MLISHVENAVLALAESILQTRLKYTSDLFFTSPDSVRRFLMLKLSEREHEVFTVLFLDNKHRLISCQEMFRGTINAASVYPREVVKAALADNANAVILAHNHPSGNVEPSQSDQVITRCLVDALDTVDIRVLDHIIVGKDGSLSFAEQALLPAGCTSFSDS